MHIQCISINTNVNVYHSVHINNFTGPQYFLTNCAKKKFYIQNISSFFVLQLYVQSKSADYIDVNMPLPVCLHYS